jgi:tight adherence protein C
VFDGLIKIVLGVLWGIFAGLAAWQCARILQQVSYITLADGRRQERRLPFLFRLLLPLTPNLAPLFARPGFDAARARGNAQLVSAGFAGLLTADELLALRVLLPAVPGLFTIVALWMLLSLVPGSAGAAAMRQLGAFALIILLAHGAYPAFWLRARVRERHKSIQRALPFVLDLLTLSVGAGLDFMNAMQRIVDRRQLDAIGEEFIRVLREMQVGKTRRNALRDMAARVGQADMTSVVNALVQADELGVGIAGILKIQADQMRNRRFERGEKMAHEAPIRLLAPLVVIVLAVLCVLLGPILLRVWGLI